MKLVARDSAEASAPHGPFDAVFPQRGTPWVARSRILTAPDSLFPIPCTPPPWGTLLAIDLASGDKRWEVPLGTTRGQAPWPFWFEIGMPSMGGPLLTASGLVFLGAAMDGDFRAVDVETGANALEDASARGRTGDPDDVPAPQGWEAVRGDRSGRARVAGRRARRFAGGVRAALAGIRCPEG